MAYKPLSIILIFLMMTVSVSASNWCTRENSLQAKEISDTIYTHISEKRSIFTTPTQKYLFTKNIFNLLFQIKSQTDNGTFKCSISGIWYKLNWDLIWLSKQIETTDKDFELLPSDIQKNIMDSKNSMY